MFMHLGVFVFCSWCFHCGVQLSQKIILLSALIPHQQRWIHGRPNTTSQLGKVSIKMSRDRAIQVAESWTKFSTQCAHGSSSQRGRGDGWCLSPAASCMASGGKEWTFCASQLLQDDLWPCRRLWAEISQGTVMKVPLPQIHVIRTLVPSNFSHVCTLILVISLCGLPSCKTRRFSWIFTFLHGKDGQALGPCLKTQRYHCLCLVKDVNVVHSDSLVMNLAVLVNDCTQWSDLFQP